MFKLLTKPTQFTKGKTEDTLCDLTQRYLLNINDDDYHLIDIIVTNKSLPETEQWKFRAGETFKKYTNITIDILSSKSNDYNSIASYIQNILTCKTKEELPNILIICYHAKRVCDDLITMFNMFGGNNFIQIENKIKFHISFDEPDANLGVTKKFIKKIKNFIDKSVIIGILFITATPIHDFWNMLHNSGIKTLLNMNYNNTQNFDDELENYRSFRKHNIIEHNNETKNPLEYISDVFSKNRLVLRNKKNGIIEIEHFTPDEEALLDDMKYELVDKTQIIDETKRKIIFAPGHLFRETEGVGSHMEIVSYFNDKNYCVFIMNGKFKGFIYPDNTKIELKQFNTQHNVNGELRESLKKWNELNPEVNLAITGYWVIERGITFNTCGFNFTDMILSSYHLSSIGKLIQLGGRGTGGKKYVNTMNIVCTSNIKETIISFNKNLEKICSLNPEYFNKTDFTDTDNTIPVKMIIHDNVLLQELIDMRSEGNRGYKQLFHNKLLQGITSNKISLHDRNNIKKFDITKRVLHQVRLYKDGDKIDARRFKTFNEAYENYKNVSQSGDENQYNIDMTKDEYVNNGFTNSTNTMWITYKYLQS